jgi:hypothetical protein
MASKRASGLIGCAGKRSASVQPHRTEKYPKSSAIPNLCPKLGWEKRRPRRLRRGRPGRATRLSLKLMSDRGLLLCGRGVRKGLAPGDLRGIRQVF